MAGLRRFLLRVYTFLWPARAERELSREVAAHLRFLEEHYARRGLAADEARRAARRAFGGVDQMKEQSRDESNSLAEPSPAPSMFLVTRSSR